MAVCFQAAQFNASSCLCQTFSTYTVLPVLYSAVLMVGLPGNAPSLWVFVAKISNKTPTNVYLINLAISNLLLCLTMPFNAAYYALGTGWPASSLMCQFAINVMTPILHSNIGVGMLILTWLALTRFATIIQHNYGHRPSKCTKFLSAICLRRPKQTPFAVGVCLGTWALVLLVMVPTVVVYATIETERVDNSSEQACYSVPVEVGGSGSQAGAIAGITVVFLCLGLVMSAYIAVIRHINRTKANSISAGTQTVLSRVCRNISVIQLVLVLCLLPHHIYKAIFIAMLENNSKSRDLVAKCHPFSVHREVKNFLLFLAALRCSTDPITYFLLDKRFKRHVCGLFREISQSSSHPQNECGQLPKWDRATLKALKHTEPSCSEASKTEHFTSQHQFDQEVRIKQN